MYYPYFRGKQFELMALRESAEVLSNARFVPIIEPVRESLKGLDRALRAISDAGGRAIVVMNPRHGHHSENGYDIEEFMRVEYRENDAISPAILLRSRTSLEDAVSLAQRNLSANGVVVHAGFTDARGFSAAIAEQLPSTTQVFIEDQANMLYRRHFTSSPRVLLRDGFEQKRNADYDPVDQFSDLHATFREMGMDGYGDFLTVGDHYSEGGGPAYAVAIHLTYIDSAQDDAMFIHHFVSDTNDTPTDPAGKFAQALEKLMMNLDDGETRLLETTAISEFRRLYADGHFPGLGFLKKLSIRHHIETLAEYHRDVHG